MKCEHFIYGLFKRYGIKLIKSPGLTKLLTSEIIEYLCQLKENKEYYWPNGTITITQVQAASDEYGRDGVWNHTIAVNILDYLAYTQPTKMLAPHFIGKLEKPPFTLQSIDVK